MCYCALPVVTAIYTVCIIYIIIEFIIYFIKYVW